MWKVVVKNILYFMHDLLPAAYSQGHWTEDAINRAVSWGEYCEKAVRHCSQDGSIHIALQNMAEKYDWVLSLHQLQSARLYFFSFILQNQLIEKRLADYVNEKVIEAFGADHNLNVLAKQQLEYHKKVMDHLSKYDEKVHSRYQVSLLLETAKSFSQEEMNTQMKQTLLLPHGLELLAEAVVSQISHGNPSKASFYFIKWLRNILQSHDCNDLYVSVVTQLGTLSPVLLCKLFAEEESLLTALFLSLKGEVMKLKPCYEGERCTWISSEDEPFVIDFKEIINIFDSLMSDDCLSQRCKEKLLCWSMEDGGMVWSYITCAINRSFN
ncbi:uncharacterized protein LOC135200331 isoform X1 [Macrobrachium nipponense]|uniref:uncharacterized protein LOC135200331 isoform X1 n=1 Tax=Macrobrachium nipponense TaxID=159736 RepID=UPI0030C7A5AF